MKGGGITIAFGWTGLWITRRHEFGSESMPKVWVISFLFMTIFLYGRQGKFFGFMREFFRYEGAQRIPVYREQVKKLKSKIRKQERECVLNEIEYLKSDLRNLNEKYSKLRSDTVLLRNLGYQIRQLKDFDFDKLKDI